MNSKRSKDQFMTRSSCKVQRSIQGSTFKVFASCPPSLHGFFSILYPPSSILVGPHSPLRSPSSSVRYPPTRSLAKSGPVGACFGVMQSHELLREVFQKGSAKQ